MLGICGALTAAAGISLKRKKSENTDERESRVEAVGMKEKASDETVIKDEAVAVENIKEAPKSEDAPLVWKCEACGHENPGDKKVCSYCGQLRNDLLNKVMEQW